ncbi:hypothetical protein ABZ345_32510 [Lentzea sp. NPDC005914]|uniref:hypothetical protein n=1 Tax=Lentzea sp. NPDC005914 TaxID=3154572 RepID=UPI0033CEE891
MRPVAFIAACLFAAGLGYVITPDDRPTDSSDSQDKAAGAPPVEVAARYQDDGIIGEAWWQMLPASVGEHDLAAGSSCAAVRDKLRGLGGVDRGWSEVTVTIRAKRPVQVVVQSVRSRLVSSAPPAPARTLLCVPDPEPYMAREDLLKYDMGFLVDQDGYSSNLLGSDPEANTKRLGFGEIHELDFKGYVRSCDCAWKIELELLVDGRKQQWQLEDSVTERPFRTIAPPQSPGDSSTNVVWCAADGRGKPTLPDRRDCPIPVVYETPLY